MKSTQSLKEPLIHYARSAFLPQKPQIVRSELRDSSTATAEARHVRAKCEMQLLRRNADGTGLCGRSAPFRLAYLE